MHRRLHRTSRLLHCRRTRYGSRATSFATVLAGLATTLRRRAEDDTIAISITASTKEHPDADPLIGYFLNTLPLLVDASRRESLSSLSQQCTTVLAAALERRSYPYTKIVADRRRAGLTPPTTSILLAFQQLEPATLGGMAAEHTILSADNAVTDATFFVQVRGHHIDLGIEYSSSVLDEDLAGLLLRDLDTVIRTAIDDPATLVGDIALPSIVPQLHGDEPLFSADEALTRTIVAHGVDRPDDIAVRFAGTSITYGELDSRSGQLAARLVSAGAGPGRFVAVKLYAIVMSSLPFWEFSDRGRRTFQSIRLIRAPTSTTSSPMPTSSFW